MNNVLSTILQYCTMYVCSIEQCSIKHFNNKKQFINLLIQRKLETFLRFWFIWFIEVYADQFMKAFSLLSCLRLEQCFYILI